MHPSQSQANSAHLNGQKQQQYSSSVGQSAMNNYANQQQLNWLAQQQNQWHFTVQNHQQVQMANSIGNSGPLKRQFKTEESEEKDEKENFGPNNKCPRVGDETDEERHERAAAEEDEEEADEEVDEEEEEDTSRSTKTDCSSPEQTSPHQSSSTTNNAINGKNGSQQQLQPQQVAHGPLQQQQHPMLAQYFGYSTPQQMAVQKNYASSIAAANGNYLAQFGMIPTTPSAHSTPMLGARNLQNLRQHLCVAPAGAAGMIGGGLSPFTHYMGGGGHYGIVAPSPTMHTQQQQKHPHAAYAMTAHSQQQLMNAYGISPSIGWNATSGQAAFMTGRSSTTKVGMFNQSATHQISPPSLNSTLGTSIGHGHRDSGLGIGIGTEQGGGGGEQQHYNKNESSSGGSSEESSLGAPKSNDIVVAANELVFPPYIRSTMLNDGTTQLIDLELVYFENQVPTRLSLLNQNPKYVLTLAELHRRLSPPECLNTSYLSAILRRAKKKQGGSHLRQLLAGYGCGLEMQTGKRKSVQVTIFTALCEREAINMVEDLEKIIKDPINGFPHGKVAEEMERRELCQHNAKSPVQQEKRLLDIRSTMEIVREAIGIVQMGMEKETQQFATIAEKMPAEPKEVNGLMPQTLDRFKRFARVSHCFGNRAILVSWQALLEVLGQLEGIQTGGS